jgi:hypothetical protein
MNRSITVCAAAALLTLGCIQEQQGFLYFNWSSVPPDETSDIEVTIEGDVVRTPPRQGLVTVVTAQGGAATAVDTTANFGLFSLRVELVPNSENRIIVSARDNTGAGSPNNRTFIVLHSDAAPASSPVP